ncbi:MAG: hypothetical protein QM705_03450 [Ancrocorticia sp.]
MPILQKEAASLSGVIAAIRISPQLRDINGGADDGYVILISEDGTTQALEAGPMDTGQLVWGESGLFFSGPTNEFLLTDDGLTSHTRGTEEVYETARFLSPGNEGFISLYNAGFGDGHYENHIVTGSKASASSWETSGYFSWVSQCDDVIIGVSDIAETALSSARPPSKTEVLMQLYPKPSNEESALLSTLDFEGEYVGTSYEAPCLNGTSYSLSNYFEQPDIPDSGYPVIRSWNISSGAHSVLPLVNEDGSPLDISMDDVMVNLGIITEGTYWWASQLGQVFSTDLESGTTNEEYQFELTSPEMGEAQFIFTEDSIFVLDVSQDKKEPLDLSRYDLMTGKRTRLMTVSSIGAIYKGDMILRDMALNPEWVTKNEITKHE